MFCLIDVRLVFGLVVIWYGLFGYLWYLVLLVVCTFDCWVGCFVVYDVSICLYVVFCFEYVLGLLGLLFLFAGNSVAFFAFLLTWFRLFG